MILGCTTANKKANLQYRKPSSDVDYGARATAQIPAHQYLSFVDLKDLLIQNKIGSVEGALSLLNAKHLDYLRFNTLMYGSFSIQASTFEEPRAIVFGPDAKFIFSFNGNPDRMGGKAIETVEYSDETQSFQFREIAFKKYPGYDSSQSNIKPDEVAFENENMVISKANPGKCLQCHGQNASPIWQSYFMWPGAYGSDDDQLFMSFDRSMWNPNNDGFFKATGKPSSQGRNIIIKPGFPDRELEGLIRYATAKPTHPRYKWLPQTIVESGAIQYARGAEFSKLDFSEQSSDERQKYNASYEWPTRPNSFLLSLLMKLNSKRLIARLQKEDLKGAFVGLDWEKLRFDEKEVLQSDQVIPVMASRIKDVISKFEFKGPRPTLQQIQKQLSINLKYEINMQRERINRQADNLGRDAIQDSPFIDHGDSAGLKDRRDGMWQIYKAQEFYSQLLGIKHPNEIDKIAFEMETDDQFLHTAVAILLADRGINLSDYTLNLRQLSLTFHSGGLDSALKYLGAR